MRPTADYIAGRFAHFNALCFGGALQPLPVRLSTARTYRGQLAFRRERGADGKWRCHSFVLRISLRMEFEPDELDDTIIHEMIHYWIHSQGLVDTSPHGHIFKQLMGEFNRRFGRHITVSHRITSSEHDSDRAQRLHLMCVCRLTDGRTGVAVVARSRLFSLWDAFDRAPTLQSRRWLASTNPYFNRFRRTLLPRLCLIDPAELEPQLADARPLLREGSRIVIGRRGLSGSDDGRND